ncbi:MAG: flagellar hook-basal body complex protein FliE [Chloroflexi bacterium]|nr:flagellar hook-basal body complex protein FliE [Chloroflexota bacterium]
MDVRAIGSFQPLERALPKSEPKAAADGSFGNLFQNALDQLNTAEKEADDMSLLLATGAPVELHDAMITMEKANISFQIALQVRNKLVEAYQEVMRMQV